MSVILCTVICCYVITSTVSADEYSTTDIVNFYVQRLEKFNEDYDAQFAFDLDNKSEAELNEIVSFYSEMTD